MVAPGDTLWDIARAHLGDPLLWPRIYKLNHGQVQADGRRLSDPDDIHPGWVLRLPARAEQPTAPARPRPEAPSAAADDDRPSSHQPSASDAPRPAGDEAAETRDEQRPSASERAHPVAARSVTIGVGAASAIGITTAAGIATALAFARAHQRRRRQPDLTAPPPRPLPRAVHMANTAFLAQAHEENDSEGTLTRHSAPAEPAAPGAVMCATRGGREISVDALAVPGGIAWSGPGADAAARALAIAVLGAAQRLRPEPPRARLLIPTAAAARLQIDTDGGLAACTLTRDCEHALDLVEQSLLHHARLADTGDDHDHAPEPDRPSPPMSILLADDHPDTRDRLGAVAHRCAPGVLAVIVLGTDDWPHHACVTTDGTLTPSNPADVPALRDVNLFTLAPHPASELLDVLHSAHDRTPSVERRDQRQPVHIVPIPPPTPPTADRDFAAVHNSTTTALSRQTGHAEDPRKPVTVRLLGGFRIYAGSTGKEFGFGLRGQAREFIALLAAHPRGIRGEEIVEHLRMSADPEQANRELGNLRRAVRRSLRQATGAHQAAFLVRSGDRIRLDPVLISTDVETFLDMLRGATAGRDEAERATSLQAAVDAYGGPLCEGADYTWADGLRETLHRKAVDALVLLADHTATLNAGDPDQALALLDKAADWDPYNEPVYQRIIRLQLAAGRDDAAQRTYQLLTRRLADIEVDPDPVTTALLRRRHHPAAAR
ncbi:BTAD domain-containing putative transcriptional regulator [Actinacidiphila sp. bgisy167]|uniref:BTAD domain-containing putative transcriptional regulator n=1 Tax=Actinacidiphila sp. bgisy167 TaxID=3413797 RepID=UPI003D7624EC